LMPNHLLYEIYAYSMVLSTVEWTYSFMAI
jgi:hypothetical protein